MPKLSPYLQKISRIEKAYNNVRPRDWQEPIDRLKELRKFSDSVVHEAAHVLTAWHSPSCSMVYRVKILDDGGITRMFIPVTLPLNELSCVLWDRIVIYLAGTVASLMTWPEKKPRGINQDVEIASFQACRLATNDGLQGDKEPWTDFEEIPTPDLRNNIMLNVSGKSLQMLEIGSRRIIALIAEHEDAFMNLCAGLHKNQKLGLFDLIAILGPKPMLPSLAILAHHYKTDHKR